MFILIIKLSKIPFSPLLGIIYPLNVHWSQHPNGWLQNGVEVDQNGSPKNLSYSVSIP